MKDDRLAACAIAVGAASLVTIDHEAIGHGSACLALGGHIKLLTSVYMDCAGGNALVAACGPLANLVVGALAWFALRRVTQPHMRLFLLLVMALSWFWEAGYLLYAMVLDKGDYAIAAHAAFGAPQWPWRIAGVAAGVALYMIAIRAVVSAAFTSAALLRLCWLAASVSAVAAAAFYAPDRLAAMGQAALEVGAASLPLLRWPGAGTVTIGRSKRWVAVSTILYVVFIATLGRGLT